MIPKILSITLETLLLISFFNVGFLSPHDFLQYCCSSLGEVISGFLKIETNEDLQKNGSASLRTTVLVE